MNNRIVAADVRSDTNRVFGAPRSKRTERTRMYVRIASEEQRSMAAEDEGS